MADSPEQIYQIKGVDRATPADESEPGSCLAIENLVPVGPPGSAYWSVATAPEQKGSSTGILSLGRQTRERIGPLADLDADPDQSLNRLLALKADGVYVIDPGQSYQERQLYEFVFSDSTRRATFTRLGESTFISVTRGDEAGVPEVTLEVRDDAVEPFQWPALPEVSISYTEVSNEDHLEEGTYVWRVAWQLDDGSLGPASGPVEEATGTPGTAGNTFEATLTIENYPSPLPASWEERVSNLIVICHPATIDDSGNVEVQAINAPGRQVADFESIEVGTQLTYGENRSEIIANEGYSDAGLQMHEYQVGAAFTYNKRLIFGDVAYDLYRPDLRQMLEWEEGVQNANGDDYWLLMRVRVRTPSGVIERLSKPLPFDTSHADGTDGVHTKSGLVFYRDSRAIRWDWFFSTDYNGSIDSATWKKVAFSGQSFTFREADGATFGFRRMATEPVDITSAETAKQEITEDSNWTDVLYSEESEWDTERDQGGDSNNPPHDAQIDIGDFTSNDLTAVTVEVQNNITETEQGSSADADASGEILIEVIDGSGTVQASAKKTTEGSFVVTLDGFTLSSGKIRIYTDAQASAHASGDDYAIAEAYFSADKVTVTTSGTASDETFSLDTDVNQDTDRDPNRIIWSEPYRPLDFPAEHIVYAGNENADPVLAITTVGQAVSEGQFGQYPLICLSKGSIRLLEVGSEPFIQSVSPITAEMGIVGRRAFANSDGIVLVVTQRGVYQLSPQLEKPALSEPLHDVRDAFLNDLTSDAAIGFYAERDRGRRELWIAGSNQTWVYSLKHGMWCQLSRQRRDFARLDNRLRGVDTQGQIQREFGSTSAQVDFVVVTGLEHFGKVGYMERLKTLLVQQRFNFEELRWKLATKDPNASQALKQEPLNRATLPDGLTARDLLPNVLVESGTDSNDRGPIVRGDMGTIPLGRGIGYSWFARFEGTGEPDQGLEGWGAEFEPRRRVRAATFFPDQPETVVLSFDVDVSSAGEVDLSFLASDGTVGDNVAAILWGDGMSDSSGDATHTYSSAGVYTIQVVAQPDFNGVAESILQGAIDASTLSNLADLTDATRIEVTSWGGGDPFGVFPASEYPPNATELVVRGTVEVKLGDVDDRFEILDLAGSSSTGNISDNPTSGIDLDYQNTQIGGTADQASTPSGAKRLAYRDTPIDDVDHQGIADAAASTLEDFSIHAMNSADSMRPLFAECRNLVSYVARDGIKKGDLSGTNANGDPILPPDFSTGLIQGNSLDAPPDDFSTADELQSWQMHARDPRWPDGALDSFVDDMHANKGLIASNATDRFGNSVQAKFRFDSGGNESNPLNQDRIRKLVGTGQYHPDAGGGGGVVGEGHTVQHGTTYSYSVFTTEPSASPPSFTIEDPNYVDGSDPGNTRAKIKTDQGGSGTVIDRFQAGNFFRIVGGQNAGLYEIEGWYRDADDNIKIEIDPSPESGLSGISTSIDGAQDGGELVGGVYWPHTK